MRSILQFILFQILFIATSYSQDDITVLKGGIILDLDDYGRSFHDIKNAIIVIQHGKIISAGESSKTKIPANAKVIDVSGKYIIPGLIDGFGSVTNQSFANAYLYLGITTVVTVEDARRGKTFYDASPSPVLYKQDEFWGSDRIEVTNKPYRFENVNYRNETGIWHDIDSMVKGGAKVMLIHYGVKSEQLPAIVAACKKHQIPTVGELGFTSYAEAVKAGIQSFVHTSRYTADILPDSVRAIYSNAPFGPPASFYYEYITRPRILQNAQLLNLADLFAKHPIGLIPTGSLLEYVYMPFATNPWKETAASLIDEKDITHEPLDKATGKPKTPSPLREKAAPILFAMDSLFIRKGAHYLTGSGATAFGTLPGVSLHTELQVLSHAGLTNRETIAATTNNFSLLWNWKHIGKIEAGRDANILVLSADPLEDLNHLKDIDLLFLQGKIIQRQELLSKKD